MARVVRRERAQRDGCVPARELSPPDRRWLDFLAEVGELAERGRDSRRRIVRGAGVT
jgi:hypothetical protein